MLAFILQRLIQAVVVMVTVAFIAFMLFLGIAWGFMYGIERNKDSGLGVALHVASTPLTTETGQQVRDSLSPVALSMPTT